MPANVACITPERTDMESFFLFFSCLFTHLCLIEGKLLCSIVLVSAIHQQEEVIGICMSPPS